jgi:hypothetical protein
MDFLAIFVLAVCPEFCVRDAKTRRCLQSTNKPAVSFRNVSLPQCIFQRCAGPICTQIERHFVYVRQFLHFMKKYWTERAERGRTSRSVPASDSAPQSRRNTTLHFVIPGVFCWLTDWLTNWLTNQLTNSFMQPDRSSPYSHQPALIPILSLINPLQPSLTIFAAPFQYYPHSDA